MTVVKQNGCTSEDIELVVFFQNTAQAGRSYAVISFRIRFRVLQFMIQYCPCLTTLINL